MNAHGTVCQICGKLVNLESPGLGDSCPGHGQSTSPTGLGTSLKNQLDAIPTPGGSQAPSSDEQTIPPASQELSGVKSQMNARPADAGTSPWGAPKGYDQVQTAGADQDFKSQLDSIPTPGGAQPPAAPAAPPRPAAPPPPPQPQAPPAPAMGDLKSQLDAIPTPGGQQAAPAPQPQAAPPLQPQAAPPPQPVAQAAPPPQPVAQAAPPPQLQTAGEEDWKSQLDAIPTPKGLDGGGGSPASSLGAGAGTGAGTGTGSGLGAGVGAGPGAVRPTPLSTPQPGAMASDMFAGGQGASNQAGLDYARSKEFSSVDTSSGYTMIAVVLVLVVLCVFGFMMMNPGKQPDFSSVPTSAPTTTTAPAPAPTPAPTTNAP